MIKQLTYVKCFTGSLAIESAKEKLLPFHSLNSFLFILSPDFSHAYSNFIYDFEIVRERAIWKKNLAFPLKAIYCLLPRSSYAILLMTPSELSSPSVEHFSFF